jgi:ubiquinone/menaquinone biosynthesis C-methylase UbiE
MIADLGADVLSIDIADRPTVSTTYFPVTTYDGRNIPAPSDSIDLVFSSNVLEHIPDLGSTLSEIRRVLRPGGTALHLMPSATWRFWTTTTAFVYLAERAVGMRRVPHGSDYVASGPPVSSGGVLRKLGQAFLPHGEFRNAFAELYHFQRSAWRRVFETNGFDVVSAGPSGFFYTAYMIFPGMSMTTRAKLSRVLGSSTNLYVTRPRVPA